MEPIQSDETKVARLDELTSHLWMVRTFLKHCDEAEEDEELCEIHREFYDFMLALGGPASEGDHAACLKVARKKLKKIQAARDLFLEIQPEVSNHTNFRMCARSLDTVVNQIQSLLDS